MVFCQHGVSGSQPSNLDERIMKGGANIEVGLGGNGLNGKCMELTEVFSSVKSQHSQVILGCINSSRTFDHVED